MAFGTNNRRSSKAVYHLQCNFIRQSRGAIALVKQTATMELGNMMQCFDTDTSCCWGYITE